jgi:hypothetical protein
MVLRQAQGRPATVKRGRTLIVNCGPQVLNAAITVPAIRGVLISTDADHA